MAVYVPCVSENASDARTSKKPAHAARGLLSTEVSSSSSSLDMVTEHDANAIATTPVESPTAEVESPVVAVNFHLIKACDSKCDFCYATFRDTVGQLSHDDARRLIDRLVAAGTRKITFAGGEPTLHRDIAGLIVHAKAAGLVTGIVTNGSRLHSLLDTAADALDWVALSVDSSDEGTQFALKRGRGDHIARTRVLAALCHQLGVRLKLNTVVTALNWQEDMSALVEEIRPDRWKVFQVLPVDGQNDGAVEPLLITSAQFAAFKQRHQHLHERACKVVFEDNDAMTNSYVMIDPLGRFYGNSNGTHCESAPILDAGVFPSLAQVGFQLDKLKERGGVYDW